MRLGRRMAFRGARYARRRVVRTGMRTGRRSHRPAQRPPQRPPQRTYQQGRHEREPWNKTDVSLACAILILIGLGFTLLAAANGSLLGMVIGIGGVLLAFAVAVYIQWASKTAPSQPKPPLYPPAPPSGLDPSRPTGPPPAPVTPAGSKPPNRETPLDRPYPWRPWN